MSEVDSIEELYGIDHGDRGQTKRYGHVTIDNRSGQTNTQSSLSFGKGFQATEWQKKLTTNMLRNDAIFALAAPAAGKTSPMVKAFYMSMIQAGNNRVPYNSPRFPRVLYVSPRTQLANQVAINDFTLGEDHGVIQLLARQYGISDSQKLTPLDQRNLLEEAYRDYVAVVAGSGGAISTVTSPKFKVKPFIAATYQHAYKIIQKYGGYINTVIIDELQEYLPKPGKPSLIDEDKSKALMSLMEFALKSKKGLVLATGSVNVNSAKQFVKFLTDTYHRPIIFDQHIKDTNRSKLTLVPFTKMRSSTDLSELAKDLISANKTNNVIITFNKKEKPQHMLSILTTAQLLQRKLPIVNKRFLFTGQRETQNLKQFTKKETNSTYDEIPKHERPLRGSDGFRDVTDVEELMYYNTAAMMSSKDGEAVHVTTRDPDNLLFQSVLRGFGFILGGMEDRQKAIVQKMFMSGTLKVLFATDAIGVGANVLAHNLFLPDLHKFEDATFGQINTSSLVQLINRAGRKGLKSGIPYANVYVREEDMELAQLVISRDPGISADEIDIDFTSNELADNMPKFQKFRFLLSRIARR